MGTLFEALEGLPDRRTRKGRRYALASVVTLSLAAMLAGAKDLLAVHRFGRRLTPDALAALGIARGRPPAHATLHYVFRSIEAIDLERALCGLTRRGDGLCTDASGHITVDGRRIRRLQHETSPGVHMLLAFATRLSSAVGGLNIPPESETMTEALTLICDLPLDDLDVALAYCNIVDAITAEGARYFSFTTRDESAVAGISEKDECGGSDTRNHASSL